MADMATIGRANPMASIEQFRNNRSNRAVNDLNMERVSQQINAQKREENAAAEEKKRQEEPLPWDIVEAKFEGSGVEGSPASFIKQIATDYRIIDTSQGVPTTNRKKNKELMQILSQPEMAQKFSRTRVNFGYKQFNAAKQALAAKPDDEKAAQALQQATVYLKQVLGADKALSDNLKDYSLAKGARRYDSSNKEVAHNPDTGGSGDKTTEALKKEMISIQAAINRVNSKGGLIEAIAQSPQFKEEFMASFGDPESKKARKNYLTALQNRYDELVTITGTDYGVKKPSPNLPTHTFIPGKGLVEVE